MKPKYYAILCITMVLSTWLVPSQSQSPVESNSGSPESACGNFYYLSNHSRVQFTAYDRKNKPAVTITYSISEVKDITGGRQSRIRTEMKDDKGKVFGSGEGIFTCENGDLSVDMHIAMSVIPMEQFKDMEVKATKAYLVYPGNMNIGENLPNGLFHMDIYRKGEQFAAMDYTVESRQVEGMEEITTPAGKWECFRITYDLVMKMKMGITIPMHYRVTEWFAPDFGVVKTVNLNKKGKLVSSAELTQIQ